MFATRRSQPFISTFHFFHLLFLSQNKLHLVGIIMSGSKPNHPE
ncbi:hypothetical protein PISS_b0121 [Pseudoalteromonas issachenkonii]|uniref:Uncharacterized protein n=1 Tax=Pseudoalteromonas issachenkonii TaxID=152297 RepID=A0ABN5C7G6_9GAMM|nr:hypothetical protein PISS_b0121 [Pseudoalteromonas issachenkonii]